MVKSHNLTSLTPLGHKEPLTIEVSGTRISEITDLSLASVTARAGQEAVVTGLISSFIGADAPSAGKWSGGTVAAFWTGPDQVFIQAPFDDYEDMGALCGAHFGSAASSVELTDGWCRFAMSGPHNKRILSLLCNVDMRSFDNHSAARSSIDHLGCFILCLSDEDVHIIGPRSSAASLHHALIAAAKSALF